jgi:hypothetical protein
VVLSSRDCLSYAGSAWTRKLLTSKHTKTSIWSCKMIRKTIGVVVDSVIAFSF